MENVEYKRTVRSHMYLNDRYRYTDPANKFPEDYLKTLKKHFWSIYQRNVLQRAKKCIVNDKEKAVLSYCFDWCVCSPDFRGDLSKGLYIASEQGFGKDVLLKTIVDFFEYFEFGFTEYTYPDFCTKWFNSEPIFFNSPIKINDIYDNGKMKREKESVPFLELLDHREQNNNRRSLLVSTNYKPDVLQDLLEVDKPNKRLSERIKECFNVLFITGIESKRISNIETI